MQKSMHGRDARAPAIHWRQMREDGLASVINIAAQLHPTYHEDDQIYAERLALYPHGCLVLEMNCDVLGYAISHPWLAKQPVTLNSLLQTLPAQPSTYYIHDVALLPGARGQGAVVQLLQNLSERAKAENLKNLSLVSVNSSHDFWSRNGFVAIDDPVLQQKLNSYDLTARFLSKDLAVV